VPRGDVALIVPTRTNVYEYRAILIA
jgi:hypothetical protein